MHIYTLYIYDLNIFLELREENINDNRHISVSESVIGSLQGENPHNYAQCDTYEQKTTFGLFPQTTEIQEDGTFTLRRDLCC